MNTRRRRLWKTCLPCSSVTPRQKGSFYGTSGTDPTGIKTRLCLTARELRQLLCSRKFEIVQLKTLYILCLSLQPNAAGQKYLDLVHGSWRSHIKRRLDQDHPVNVTMFKGDYVMHVRQNGHVIHQENFTVDSSGKDLTVHLTGQHQSKIYNLISNNTVFAYI